MLSRLTIASLALNAAFRGNRKKVLPSKYNKTKSESRPPR
jgi:hypothetical protein